MLNNSDYPLLSSYMAWKLQFFQWGFDGITIHEVGHGEVLDQRAIDVAAKPDITTWCRVLCRDVAKARGSHLPLPHVGSHLPLLKVEVGANVTLA